MFWRKNDAFCAGRRVMVSSRQEARHFAYILRQKGYSGYMVWRELRKRFISANIAQSTVEHWLTAMRKNSEKFMKGPAVNRIGNKYSRRVGKRPLTRADAFRIINHVKKSPKMSYRRVPVAMQALGIDVSKSTVHRLAQTARKFTVSNRHPRSF